MNTNPYKENILVVDDNPIIHVIFKKILDEDYSLTYASNGREALRILKDQQPPDLVLLDIMMPEMNGYELFAEIKKDNRLARIPIIFVTALDSETDQLKGLSSGAVDYITKPIEKRTLRARIEHCLEFSRYIRLRQNQHPRIDTDLIDSDQPPEPEPAIQPTVTKTKAKLMVIDNDPHAHQTIDKALSEIYVIEHLRKGTEITDRITPNNIPDLIMMDVMLPGFDGFDLIRQLKEDERTKAIPIIFITSRNSKEDEAKGFELGCADYIHKPISIPILKARVHIHLELSRQRQMFEKRLEKFLTS